MLTAKSAREALALLACNEVQVIMTDQRMPEMDGAELLKRVGARYPHTLRIVLSGYGDIEHLHKAVSRGEIYKFFTKPWDEESLRKQVLDAFRHQAERVASSHGANAPVTWRRCDPVTPASSRHFTLVQNPKARER